MAQAKNYTPLQRKAEYDNWTKEDLTWIDPAGNVNSLLHLFLLFVTL